MKIPNFEGGDSTMIVGIIQQSLPNAKVPIGPIVGACRGVESAGVAAAWRSGSGYTGMATAP
jgi:hypothetical protein